jgi:hypothetical protein
METLPVVLIGVLVVGLIAGAIMLSRWIEKRRTAEWQAAAPILGLAFSGADAGLPGRFPGFKSFASGRGRNAANVLRGERGGATVTLADYRYTTGSGKSQRTYRETICIVEKPDLGVPQFFTRPEGWLDHVGALLGGQDFDFDDDPDFSKGWVLQGGNEQAVRAAFDRPARDWFKARHGSGLRVEGNSGVLVVVNPKAVPPATAGTIVDGAVQLAALWSR